MLFNKIKNKLKYLIFLKKDDVILCDLECVIIIYLKKLIVCNWNIVIIYIEKI